jgi:hypothetical protein
VPDVLLGFIGDFWVEVSKNWAVAQGDPFEGLLIFIDMTNLIGY